MENDRRQQDVPKDRVRRLDRVRRRRRDKLGQRSNVSDIVGDVKSGQGLGKKQQEQQKHHPAGGWMVLLLLSARSSKSNRSTIQPPAGLWPIWRLGSRTRALGSKRAVRGSPAVGCHERLFRGD